MHLDFEYLFALFPLFNKTDILVQHNASKELLKS